MREWWTAIEPLRRGRTRHHKRLFLQPKRGKQVLAERKPPPQALTFYYNKAGAFGKMKTSELSYNKMFQ